MDGSMSDDPQLGSAQTGQAFQRGLDDAGGGGNAVACTMQFDAAEKCYRIDVRYSMGGETKTASTWERGGKDAREVAYDLGLEVGKPA